MATEKITHGTPETLARKFAVGILEASLANAEERAKTGPARPSGTKEDAAIFAFNARAAENMRQPSREVQVQQDVDALQAQTTREGKKARVKQWADSLTDEELARWASKQSPSTLRKFDELVPGLRESREPEPAVEDTEWWVQEDTDADDGPVVGYDRLSIEDGYEPVGGFRYPDGTEDVYESVAEGDDDEEDLT
jgi:hypothetical protein